MRLLDKQTPNRDIVPGAIQAMSSGQGWSTQLVAVQATGRRVIHAMGASTQD